MDSAGFERFLKKFGKKAHVIASLVAEVQGFEAFLSKSGMNLDTASEQKLQAYASAIPSGQVKEAMRAIALYYKFIGKPNLVDLANSMREQEIAQTRQDFKLRNFRGIDPEEVAKLEAVGIVTVEHMRQKGQNPAARERLAQQTGVPLAIILELVKLSDLSRLSGVKAVRARLYYDAGLDTPAKFAAWEPEALQHMLEAFVQRTGFEGIAPLPKEIQSTLFAAKKLPQVVVY